MELRSRSYGLAITLVVIFGAGCVLGGSVFEGSNQVVDVKSFLSEICDSSSSLKSIMVKSLGVDHIDRSLEHLCTEGAHGILVWLKAENFDNVSELDTSLKFVGRASFDEHFAGYCTYDPATKICSNEQSELTSSIIVLGEKYPERYELRDVVYKKWTNSTRLGSPILAYATLKNRDPTYKYIDQDISYLSDARLEYILNGSVIAGLPLSIYKGKLEAYKTVAGETHYSRSFKTINAVRYMSPATIINVTVTGTEEKAYREFRAKLVTVYTDDEGIGWGRALSSIQGAAIETSLTETHVDYGVVASLYDESLLKGVPSTVPPHTHHEYQEQPSVKSENIHIHISETELTQVYPGFRNVAIGAAILVFSILGIALLDILRRVLSDRRAKRMRTGKYSKVDGR